jgi:RNA polymerase sigma-70 factor (ECF subfamily)
VVETFLGGAKGARSAVVSGAPGAVRGPGGRPRVAFGFTIRRRKIVAIDLLADAERLSQLG